MMAKPRLLALTVRLNPWGLWCNAAREGPARAMRSARLVVNSTIGDHPLRLSHRGVGAHLSTGRSRQP